ncbi:MAG: phenyltransferase domain-containing protein [Desulfococcaceae bacterium]
MRVSINRSVPHSLPISDISGLIRETQKPDGEIPWTDDEKTDPWDHVESAMALNVAGDVAFARRAWEWSARNQLPDGGWFSACQNGIPIDRTRESHMATYLAAGLFHDYLIHKDRNLLERMWPTVESAVDFALRLQAAGGEVFWALNPAGEVDPMALLAASSSVFLGLRCAVAIGELLNRPRPRWVSAMERLGYAIRECPHLFNMTKARFSMDWFYPVLCGAITGEAAERRLEQSWKKFVVTGQGVRCVSDRPWVTVAETCELCLALCAMGRRNRAEIVFDWIAERRDPDGAYWCGFTFPDMTIWPEDRLTWTNAAVLLAADAIYGLTPGGRIFDHSFWHSRLGNLCGRRS